MFYKNYIISWFDCKDIIGIFGCDCVGNNVIYRVDVKISCWNIGS